MPGPIVEVILCNKKKAKSKTKGKVDDFNTTQVKFKHFYVMDVYKRRSTCHPLDQH